MDSSADTSDRPKLARAVEAAAGRWRGELSYYAAPYGVAYFVANWETVR